MRKTKVTYQYCFSHTLKYLCVLFTVGLSYAIMEEVFTAKSFNISLLTPIRNVVCGNIWDHMWFVYEIIGIYLVMPVICHFIQQSKKEAYILTALLFVFNILFPVIENFMPVGVNIPFCGYLFYVCFGALVSKFNIEKRFFVLSCLAFLLSIVYILLSNSDKQFGYKNLIICIMAISIFLIVSRMDIKPSRLIECISKCTWGIYLIHPFFINVIIKLLKVDLITSCAYIKLFAFSVVIAVASFFSTYMLRKVPIVKKLF